jgi:hypothetical protein
MQLHQRFAEADLNRVDLPDSFERWLPNDQYGACRTLLPALGLSSRADVPRLERLLRLVSEREDALPQGVGEALTARFASQPSLAERLVACFSENALISERAVRVLANSFAAAQAVPAAKFVIDRLGPPPTDSRAIKPLLAAIPWRAGEVRRAIEPHRPQLLSYLSALADTDAEESWYR